MAGAWPCGHAGASVPTPRRRVRSAVSVSRAVWRPGWLIGGRATWPSGHRARASVKGHPPQVQPAPHRRRMGARHSKGTDTPEDVVRGPRSVPIPRHDPLDGDLRGGMELVFTAARLGAAEGAVDQSPLDVRQMVDDPEDRRQIAAWCLPCLTLVEAVELSEHRARRKSSQATTASRSSCAGRGYPMTGRYVPTAVSPTAGAADRRRLPSGAPGSTGPGVRRRHAVRSEAG